MNVMDVVVIFNGLGNQMSQYAFYLAKKKDKSNCHVIYDPKSANVHNGAELKRVFGIELNRGYVDKIISYFYGYIFNKRIVNKLFSLVGIRIIHEPKNYDYQEKLLKPSFSFISFYWGGWHSEKYFKDIELEVRTVFEFPVVKNSPYFAEWFNRISLDNNSVSIHIRRGDYLDKPSDPYYQFNGVCTIDYYEKAILYIKERVLSPNFYIFSNDINWCMKTFGTENMYYVDCNKGKDSWRDMYLMSKCRHHINANSTFSWWAAWLSPHSNGMVLHPKYFIKNIETKDYYPEKWIMIE